MTFPKQVHIITGFLGAGKTTCLNQLLRLPAFANTLVIVNEFGEVPVDHHLIESNTETIFELSNGCLCCSIRGELVETLLQLDASAFERIIIETTGIADPLPIFQSLTLEEIRLKGLAPGSILTVCDASRGRELIEQHDEVRHQLALADQIILTHLEKTKNIDDAQDAIRQCNQRARILNHPTAVNLKLTEKPLAQQIRRISTGHKNAFSSIVLETDKPQPLPQWIGFLNYLASACNETLLRAKGLALVEETDKPVILQMSGPIVHAPVELEGRKTEITSTRLVVILKDGNPNLVQSLFDSFFDNPQTDTPDREALTNNPLAIPGT